MANPDRHAQFPNGVYPAEGISLTSAVNDKSYLNSLGIDSLIHLYHGLENAGGKENRQLGKLKEAFLDRVQNLASQIRQNFPNGFRKTDVFSQPDISDIDANRIIREFNAVFSDDLSKKELEFSQDNRAYYHDKDSRSYLNSRNVDQPQRRQEAYNPRFRTMGLAKENSKPVPPVSPKKSLTDKAVGWGIGLLPPLILLGGMRGCSNEDPIQDQIPPEIKVVYSNPANDNYLRYTVETGKARMAKQGFADVEQAYAKAVENTGRFPQEIKDLVKQHHLADARDDEKGINIRGDSQRAVTALLVLSESYPAAQKAIHQLLTAPESMKPSGIIAIKKAARQAAAVAPEGENIITTMNGLHGAAKETGPSVKFENPDQQSLYNAIVKATNDGQGRY